MQTNPDLHCIYIYIEPNEVAYECIFYISMPVYKLFTHHSIYFISALISKIILLRP